MDGILDLILRLIDINRILALPAYVGVAGLAIAAIFAWSAITSLFKLKPIQAFSRLVLAIIVVIILSQAGEAIVQLLGIEQPPATERT